MLEKCIGQEIQKAEEIHNLNFSRKQTPSENSLGQTKKFNDYFTKIEQ